MSMPFHDEEFTFTQPDGTQLRVRGSGDQYSAIFETLDGYTIVREASTGYYHYAGLSGATNDLVPSQTRVGPTDQKPAGLERHIRPSAAILGAQALAASAESPTAWQTRIEEQKAARRALAAAPAERSVTGTYVGLCLLIQFPDVPGTIPQSEVERFCNERGYSGFGNNGSVCDYFLSVSDGKLTYTNIVAPYYTTKHGRDYYTDESQAPHKRAQELIEEALTHLVSAGFDCSNLTTDNRHRVYALNVFYTGKRVNNWHQGLWPHSGHLQRSYALGNGKLAHDYQITDMTAELTLGTFCHENGHMICDFPDLYDKKAVKSYGVGRYCLMCSGGKPPNAKNPIQVGAYLKNKAGWTSRLEQVTPGATISLQAGRNEFAVHRKSSTEYYIIENRQRSGRDAGLPSVGLAVWHVDENVHGNNDEQMTPTEHYECSLMQADGNNDLERKVNIGDAKDFFHAGGGSELSDSTRPNTKWWDGMSSGLHIRNISAAGPTMSFTCADGSPPPAKRRGFLSRIFGLRSV